MIRFLSLVVLLFLMSSACNNPSPQPLTPVTDKIQKEKQTQESNRLSDEGQKEDQRLSWQKPDEVIAALGNIEDKVIADLGAGIGYFSFKLRGKCEKVIAIDIDRETIQVLNGFKSTLSEQQQSKFDVRLATPQDPQLRPQEVDVIFIVNTVGFFSDRKNYLSNLKNYLKKDGELFIVDFKSKHLPDYVGAAGFENRVYMHVLETELAEAGYKNIVVDDTTLDFQYMLSARI